MNQMYENRELSWLKFNERVLEEATDSLTPPLEKLRFLSIVTSNLDEFYMVRVGSLTDHVQFGKQSKDDKSGMTEAQQVQKILHPLLLKQFLVFLLQFILCCLVFHILTAEQHIFSTDF